MKKGRFSFRAACFSCRRIFFIQKKNACGLTAGALSCCHHVRGFIFKTSEDFFFLNKKILSDLPVPINSLYFLAGVCPACPPSPGDLLHSRSQIQVGFFKGLPVPLQTFTPTAPPPLPSTNNPKNAVFHPKLPATSPNQAAQMGASCLKSPALGNSAPAGEFGSDEDVESRWALQVSPAVSPLPAQPHVPVPSLWGRSGLLRGQRHPRHGHPRGLREGQEVAALAPRLGPCFLFRCGWDFPALAVGPRSAPAAALFSISKAAEADGFNATAISSVPKAGGTGHLPGTPGGFGQGRRWQSPWDTRASPPCPAVSHPTASQGDKATARIFLEPGLRLFPRFLILF